jgi:hypothetical protein
VAALTSENLEGIGEKGVVPARHDGQWIHEMEVARQVVRGATHGAQLTLEGWDDLLSGPRTAVAPNP